MLSHQALAITAARQRVSMVVDSREGGWSLQVLMQPGWTSRQKQTVSAMTEKRRSQFRILGDLGGSARFRKQLSVGTCLSGGCVLDDETPSEREHVNRG